MKKVKFFLIILTLFFICKSIYSETIINIAYIKVQNLEIESNSVIIDIVEDDGKISFYEHVENIKDQYLNTENNITTIGELDLSQVNNSEVYFKTTMLSSFYPDNFEFFIVPEDTNELIKVENDSTNSYTSKKISLSGRKKYKVIFKGTNIKDTFNIDKGEFILEAFTEDKNLGGIKNTLNIDNELIFKENEKNEEIQYLNYKNEIKIIGDVLSKNLLNESGIFILSFDTGFYVDNVIATLGDEEIKFYWDPINKYFYSEEVIIPENKTIEVIGLGINNSYDLEKTKFNLSLIVNKKNYGTITNTLIMTPKDEILLEKTVNQNTIKVGDLLKYKLKIKTSENNMFDNFFIIDTLPRGFTIVEKSIKTSEGIIDNIKKTDKNRVSFEINKVPLETGLEIEVEYLVKINVTAKIGKNINTAVAYGINDVNRLKSNIASVGVELENENFYDKGIIIGLVYLNLDDDLEYDSKVDIPIPGVRVILENGDFAITDENGKYSIYGVSSKTHIAKIDMDSVPTNLIPLQLNSKFSKNGESQFVDLKKAQLYKADFAFKLLETNKVNLIKNQLLERSQQYEELIGDEIFYQIDNNELNFNQNSIVDYDKELGDRGTIRNHENIEFVRDAKPILEEKEIENLEEKYEILENGKEVKVIPEVKSQETKEKIVTLKDRIKILSAQELTEQIEDLDNELDIINIENNDIVLKSMTFQIKSPLNGSLDLFINNEKVGLNHIGLRASSDKNSLFFLEYVAVPLKEGENIVRASYFDMFGIERSRVEKKVLVRDKLSKVHLEKIDQGIDAETVKFILKGTDINDIMMDHHLNATIEIDSKYGDWITQDLDENVNGLQVMIPANAEKVIEFKPKPGKKNIKVNVKIEDIEDEIDTEIYGKTKELFFNGIVEGRFNFNKNQDNNFFFEDKINNLYNNQLYYRAALFAEGHLNDDYYMTLTYDSAKEDEKFFSYRDPEDYYPIYGDNSIKGYIGESKEDLYIKLQREESYIMYGDYRTANLFDSRLRLNQYSRTLTGVSSQILENKYFLTTFIAKTNSEKIIDEFQGEGISGPYILSNRDIIEGSESVNIITYNKNTGILLEEISLVPGLDYVIDYDLGRIYFSEPIMSMDLNFNPIFIRVSYEIENSNADKHYVYGAHGMINIWDNIFIGATYVKDNNKIESFEMIGGMFLYQNENNMILLENSKTSDYEEGSGEANSFYYKFENERLKLKLLYEKSDEGYYNPDSKVRAGVDNLEFIGEYEFTNGSILKFKSEVLKEMYEDKEYTKKDIYTGIEFPKIGNFIYEIGVKHYFKDEDLDQESINTVAGRVIWDPEEYDYIRAFIEYEQDILLSDKKRLAAGIDYDIDSDTVGYIRQEFSSDLGTNYYLDPEDDSNRTLVGIKSTKYFGSEIFGEYREVNEDEFIKPEFGTGIKRVLEVNEFLKFYGTFERVDPITKVGVDENRKSETALTFGSEYQLGLTSKMRSDFEIKFGEKTSFLNKLGYANQLNESLYFITKNRYYTDGNDEIQNRFILGLAYRDALYNRYNSLNKFEVNYSKGIIDEGYKRLSTVLRSAHNYKLNQDTESTLTLGIKNILVEYESIENNYTAFLIAGSINKNLYENWNVGLNITTIFDDKKNIDSGVGIELGYLFNSSVWLSLGYNITGFNDKDFDRGGEYTQGVYLRFRINIGDYLNRLK